MVGTLGMEGGMAYGCLDFNNSNTVLLFGTLPWDVTMRQGFEKIPSCAHTIADASFFISGSECRLSFTLTLLTALAYKSNSLPILQSWHKDSYCEYIYIVTTLMGLTWFIINHDVSRINLKPLNILSIYI